MSEVNYMLQKGFFGGDNFVCKVQSFDKRLQFFEGVGFFCLKKGERGFNLFDFICRKFGFYFDSV